MDYHELVTDELDRLVDQAMKTPAKVYAAGLEDLTEFHVYVNDDRLELQDALIYCAIHHDAPWHRGDVLTRCNKVMREALARKLLPEAMRRVDASLSDPEGERAQERHHADYVAYWDGRAA